MAMQDTGTRFFNKATTIDGDAKLSGVQFVADFDGTPVVLAKAADDTLTIRDGDKYLMPKPQFNKFGCFWIEEVRGQRYFFSPRTNDRGSYVIAKLAKPKADDGGAPAAPKTYGKR